MSAAAPETAVPRVARALADPTRFGLLRAIAAQAELSCRELTARFPVSQATVSHHLRVLAEAGLVAVREEGPYHYYRAVPGALAAHARALRGLARPRASSAARSGAGEAAARRGRRP